MRDRLIRATGITSLLGLILGGCSSGSDSPAGTKGASAMGGQSAAGAGGAQGGAAGGGGAGGAGGSYGGGAGGTFAADNGGYSVGGYNTGGYGVAGYGGTWTGGEGGAEGPQRVGPVDVAPISASASALAASCEQRWGERLPCDSVDSLRSMLQGAWVICSGHRFFGQYPDGIYITPDDRWAFLTWSGDQLVVQPGPENRGRVSYTLSNSEDTFAPTTLSSVGFVNDLGWSTWISPVISDRPRLMLSRGDGSDLLVFAPVTKTGAGGPISGAGGAGGAGGAIAPITVTAAETATLCQEPLGQRLAVKTPADLLAASAGAWVVCADSESFLSGHTGIYIGPDGRWAYLDRSGDQLLVQSGMDHEGPVHAVECTDSDVPSYYEAAFVDDLQWGSGAGAIFSDKPRRMVLAADSPPTVLVPVWQNAGSATGGSGGGSGISPIALAPAAAQALCQKSFGEALSADTGVSLRPLLSGAWVLCSEQGIFNHAQAGIYIKPDDRWAYMARSGDQLTVLSGMDNEGSIHLFAGSGQVNFINDMSRTIGSFPSISDQPRLMSLSQAEGNMTYAHVP